MPRNRKRLIRDYTQMQVRKTVRDMIKKLQSYPKEPYTDVIERHLKGQLK
jgi:hypothetical protein